MFTISVAGRCGWVLCLAFAVIAVPAFGQEAIYRLNAGGSWYTDTAGNEWEPDNGYHDYGVVGLTSSPISGTLDDPLYQTERYGIASQPQFAYHLPVALGTYRVRLHFAEIYSGISASNPRIFSVMMEGLPALTNYNILATAGFATAVVEEFDVDVTDGELDIQFVRVRENPKISGIEVLSSAGPVPGPELTISPAQLVFGDVQVGNTLPDSATLSNSGDQTLTISAITLGGANPAAFADQHAALPINLAPGQSTTLNVTFTPPAASDYAASISISSNDPAGAKSLALSGFGVTEGVAVYRVNAGGGAYTDPDGNPWQSDSGLFNTGSTFSTTRSIAGTTNQTLYRSERYDAPPLAEMMYSLPVSAGIYTVRLHFAEIWFTAANQRLFDVSIEGQLVLNDFDIVATGGSFTAVVETFDVEVTDGALNILFGHVKENPKISGIEVFTQQADVTVDPRSLDFGTVNVDETSSPQTVTVSNDSGASVQIQSLDVTGANAGDFSVEGLSLPYTVPAGGSAGIDVVFSPSTVGQRQAALGIGVSGGRQFSVALSGTGEGTTPPVGTVYRINAGGGAFIDGSGNAWASDAAFYNTGSSFTTTSPIAGTTNDFLYQSQRYDAAAAPEMTYTFPMGAGSYLVRLHFAETFSGITRAGQRVFNVLMEGQPVLSNFDIFREAGLLTALVKQFTVSVTDGALQIQFVHGVENPCVSGIEILGQSTLTPSVSLLDWGTLPLNTPGPIKSFYLNNNTASTLTVTSLAFLVDSGTGENFRVNINGSVFYGESDDVTYPLNLAIAGGGSKQISVAFTPTVPSQNVVALTFSGAFGSVAVQLRGTGEGSTPSGSVHAVIEAPPYFIDYDMDGFSDVWLSGDTSYTTEAGRRIVGYRWSINNVTFSNSANTSYRFPLGYTTYMLTVWDDSVPAKSNSTTAIMNVPRPDDVPGTLVQFYDSHGANPATLLDALPATCDYGTKLSTLYIGTGSTVVPSPYSGNVVVQFLAQLDLNAGTYQFIAGGGSASRLFLNGSPLSGSIYLTAGRYRLDARFAIPSTSYLPIRVDMSTNGGPFLLPPADIVTHSQYQLHPIINYILPEQGSRSGGYQITLSGMGYVPFNQCTVHWGGTTIANQYLTVQSSAIRFTAPAGSGTVNVYVENPYGVSNTRTFTYY